LVADHRLIDEAIKVARGRLNELSRQETRALLVKELKERGLMLPPPLVDYYLNDVVLGAGTSAKVHRLGQGAVGASRLVSSIIRAFRQGVEQHEVPGLGIPGMRQLVWDPRRRTKIILDSNANELLAIPRHDMISIWFDFLKPTGDLRSSAGAPETSLQVYADSPVLAFLGDERVGMLGPEASEAYRALVQQSWADEVTPVTVAIRSRDSAGAWQLDVGLPLR
jgi:hypothetical protein